MSTTQVDEIEHGNGLAWTAYGTNGTNGKTEIESTTLVLTAKLAELSPQDRRDVFGKIVARRSVNIGNRPLAPDMHSGEIARVAGPWLVDTARTVYGDRSSWEDVAGSITVANFASSLAFWALDYNDGHPGSGSTFRISSRVGALQAATAVKSFVEELMADENVAGTPKTLQALSKIRDRAGSYIKSAEKSISEDMTQFDRTVKELIDLLPRGERAAVKGALATIAEATALATPTVQSKGVQL